MNKETESTEQTPELRLPGFVKSYFKTQIFGPNVVMRPYNPDIDDNYEETDRHNIRIADQRELEEAGVEPPINPFGDHMESFEQPSLRELKESTAEPVSEDQPVAEIIEEETSENPVPPVLPEIEPVNQPNPENITPEPIATPLTETPITETEPYEELIIEAPTKDATQEKSVTGPTEYDLTKIWEDGLLQIMDKKLAPNILTKRIRKTKKAGAILLPNLPEDQLKKLEQLIEARSQAFEKKTEQGYEEAYNINDDILKMVEIQSTGNLAAKSETPTQIKLEPLEERKIIIKGGDYTFYIKEADHCQIAIEGNTLDSGFGLASDCQIEIAPEVTKIIFEVCRQCQFTIRGETHIQIQQAQGCTFNVDAPDEDQIAIGDKVGVDSNTFNYLSN